MLTVSKTTAIDRLSHLLRQVKRGERILITEHHRPIAEIRPFNPSPANAEESVLASLYQSGVLTPPTHPNWDVQAFLSALPSGQPLPDAQSLVTAVREERLESP